MRVTAGILGVVFALLHGVSGVTMVRAPEARAQPQPFTNPTIPRWARALWLILAGVTLVGSAIYLGSSSVGAAVTLSVGAVGLWLLAVANGFWLHGRPKASHHLVRGAIVALLLVLTFVGLN